MVALELQKFLIWGAEGAHMAGLRRMLRELLAEELERCQLEERRQVARARLAPVL